MKIKPSYFLRFGLRTLLLMMLLSVAFVEQAEKQKQSSNEILAKLLQDAVNSRCA